MGSYSYFVLHATQNVFMFVHYIYVLYYVLVLQIMEKNNVYLIG